MPIHQQRTFQLTDHEVGEVVRALRWKADLDLRSASDAGGIDWRVLSRIERGERPCRVTELVTLSDIYGYSPERVMRAITRDEELRERILKSGAAKRGV